MSCHLLCSVLTALRLCVSKHRLTLNRRPPTHSLPRLPLRNSLNGSVGVGWGGGMLSPSTSPPYKSILFFRFATTVVMCMCTHQYMWRSEDSLRVSHWPGVCQTGNRQGWLVREPQGILFPTFPVPKLNGCAVINLRSFYVGSVN